MILNRLLILSVLFVAGCGTTHRPEIDRAETVMNEQPDSALVILQKMRIDEIRGRRNKARYALLYSQALDKNYIDVDNDSLIRIARDYYAHRGSNEERAKAFYYYGTVANNAGDIDGAMKAYVPARMYAEKTGNEYIKGLIYSATGMLYYDQNSLTEATSYLILSARSFKSSKSYNNQLLSLKNIGELYRIRNNTDSALLYLNRAKNIAIENSDTAQILNIELKIQRININSTNNYDSLDNYKQDLFKMYNTLNNGNIPDEHYMILGVLYSMQLQQDSARLLLNKALCNTTYISSNNIGIYASISYNEKQAGNYKESLHYRELYNHLSDSIIDIQNKNLIEKLEAKYKTQYIQRSYEVLEAKHRLQKLTNMLIAILALIAGGTMFFIYRNAMRRKNEKITEYRDYIEDVKSNYEGLLSKYDTLKSSTALNGHNEEKLLELLGRRIDSLKALCDLSIKNPLSEAFQKKFAQYMNLENKENKALAEDLISLTNIIHNDIITSMAGKFELTDHEQTFCACVMLDFNKEDIRVLFNHTNMSSIYNTRCKMRDKFGIKGAKVDLLKYIRMIREDPQKYLQ